MSDLAAVSNFDVEELCTLIETELRPKIGKEAQAVVQVLKDNAISGDVFVELTEQEIHDLLPDLKSGDKKKLWDLIKAACLAKVSTCKTSLSD